MTATQTTPGAGEARGEPGHQGSDHDDGQRCEIVRSAEHQNCLSEPPGALKRSIGRGLGIVKPAITRPALGSLECGHHLFGEPLELLQGNLLRHAD